MMNEWQKFTEGLAAPGHDVDGWASLITVTHTTHLVPAIRIAEDRTLSAELIYDGKLNTTRTKVIYFSPNYWNDGSRYGSINFTVDWASVLNDRKMYWVEAINSYSVPIYRFLLSNKDVTALPVQPYDPMHDNGPIRKVGDAWYWATGYAAEVVIDEDLSVYDVTKLAFGSHHDSYCSLGQAVQCRESGSAGSLRAAGNFMAALLGRSLNILDQHLTTSGSPSDECKRALSKIALILTGKGGFNGPITDAQQALDLVKAACLTLQHNKEHAIRLVQMIGDQSICEAALLALIRTHFNDASFVWD